MNNKYSGWSLDLNDWELLRNTLKMMKLDWYKSPLKISRNRFVSHCKGELTGVRELVRTWLPANLDFQYAIVKSKIDERDIETLIYDLETELMNAFGTPANKRNQKTSYLSECI